MLATSKMPTYTRGDLGERIVHSLAPILDDPVAALNQSRRDVGRPEHTHLDILSASSYPYALSQGVASNHTASKRKQSDTGASQQLYGGIFRKAPSPRESNESSSSLVEQEPAPRPKKRAKKSKKVDEDVDNDDSRRQRGRPRLDTQDQTAADRRRTQIRLAQRAYRHRKETTISGLKQRVHDLQNTIEQMSKTFISLHDNLIDSGVTTDNTGIARQLQKATQEFTQLVKVSEPEFDDEATEIAKVTGAAQGGHDNRFEAHQEQETQPYSQAEVSPRAAPSDGGEVEEISPNGTSMAFLDSNHWANMNNDIMSFRVQVPETQINLMSLGDKARDSAEKLFPNSTMIEYPLSSPHAKNGSYTYSFQETSFSRRLHRRTLEAAWRNLTNPLTDPAILNRSFRFTFCFSNRKRILLRFKELLQRKAGESLENWNVPYFQIGGAGTHFPRRDKDGSPIYPPNMLSAEKALVCEEMGPHQWVGQGAETPRADLADTQTMLANIGYGGEWFDSHDVEEYLKTKGVFLDGQSNLIEVDASVVQPQLQKINATTTSRTNSSSSTSPSDNALRTPSPAIPSFKNMNMSTNNIPDIFTNQDLNTLFPPTFPPSIFFPPLSEKDTLVFPQRPQEHLSPSQVYNTQIWPWVFPNSYPTNLDDTSGLSLSDDVGSLPDTTGFGNSPRLMTLDVEQLVERLVDGAVCLGRAPGFRKEMVENALALSVSVGF